MQFLVTQDPLLMVGLDDPGGCTVAELGDVGAGGLDHSAELSGEKEGGVVGLGMWGLWV